MIEHAITDRLLANDTVKGYCNGNVWATYAPDGTECPYIVITESDAPVGDDVINTFDIMISIYDYAPDKRPLKDISASIEYLLDCETFDDIRYGNIRVRFGGREHIKENESTLSRMFMQFTARATKEFTDNN
jgi:hypothetical protein